MEISRLFQGRSLDGGGLVKEGCAPGQHCPDPNVYFGKKSDAASYTAADCMSGQAATLDEILPDKNLGR